jgi:mxaC protein
MTQNKQAVQAAIAATDTPALAYTNISKGLAMALSVFHPQPAQSGSNIILLVSDGAAAIDLDSERKIRQWFKQQPVRLYWIFLRGKNSPGLYQRPEDPRNDNAQAMPERYLHIFFKSLGVPYKAYQAESRDALQKAIEDIDRFENRPLHYLEKIPRQDLSGYCYFWATVVIGLLLAGKLSEARP